MNHIQRTLTAAKAIIADPAKWIKGKYAIHKDNAASMGHGSKVPPYANSLYGYEAGAACFCSIGALQKAAGEGQTYYEASYYLRKAVTEVTSCKFDHAARFNDAESTTHEDVMAMFDKAIELAAEKQS